MRTSVMRVIPLQDRFDVCLYKGSDGVSEQEWYFTDTWDDIKEEHKPLCAVLDAIIGDLTGLSFGNPRTFGIDNVGSVTIHYHAPPTYRLYVEKL